MAEIIETIPHFDIGFIAISKAKLDIQYSKFCI